MPPALRKRREDGIIEAARETAREGAGFMENIGAVIEAILFVAGDPVRVEDLAHAMNLTSSEMAEALEALSRMGMDRVPSTLQITASSITPASVSTRSTPKAAQCKKIPAI